MGEAYKERVKARLMEGLDGRPLTWLEDQTGDSYKNVQRWVSGDTMPPPDFLARAAKVLQVEPGWLLTGKGEMHPTPPDEAQKRLRLVRVALDSDDVAALIDLLEGLDPDVD